MDNTGKMTNIKIALNGMTPAIWNVFLILLAIIGILILGLIVYFIYLCIVYHYPRPYWIGHSEALEQFMTGYVPELVTAMRSVRDDPSADAGIKGMVNDLFGIESKFKSGQKLVPDTASDDPNSAPFLYLFFALGSKYSSKAIVGISPRLVPGLSMADELHDACFYDAVPEPFIADIQLLHDKIFLLQEALKKAASSVNPTALRTMNLAFLLDDEMYLENIWRMFKFRYSGGLNNMTLLEITMMDYIKYVWVPPKGQVPFIWMNWLNDVKAMAESYIAWLNSPEVSSFVYKLPATIGGVEAFEVETENEKDKGKGKPEKGPGLLEGFLLPPHTKPGDTIEEFGFLKGLLEIPKILQNMATVIMTVGQALIEAITNPIKVLQIIIGIIVGVTLVILYIVIKALSFVMYAPAAIYVTVADVLNTIWLVFLFVIQASVYMVLWLIDILTGGLMLKIMRCENLPSKWFTQPGYFFDNKYLRGFMCNFTCSKRFLPDAQGGWCERMRMGRPSFCPQQIIYNAARTLLTGAESSVIKGDTPDSELTYKFVIPPSYYGLDEVNKKGKIVKYLKDKQSYVKKCHGFSKEFSNFTLSACEYFYDLKLNYELSPDNKTRDAGKVALYEQYKDLVEKAVKVCTTSHCNNAEDIGVPRGAMKWCPPDIMPIEEQTSDEADEKTMAHRVVYTALTLSVVMVVFVAMYLYTKDVKFDFIKYLSIKPKQV